VRYGLADVEQLAELGPASTGAAAYMAQVDARVAAILKDWTF
jgi:hypothetical protein